MREGGCISAPAGLGFGGHRWRIMRRSVGVRFVSVSTWMSTFASDYSGLKYTGTQRQIGLWAPVHLKPLGFTELRVRQPNMAAIGGPPFAIGHVPIVGPPRQHFGLFASRLGPVLRGQDPQHTNRAQVVCQQIGWATPLMGPKEFKLGAV